MKKIIPALLLIIFLVPVVGQAQVAPVFGTPRPFESPQTSIERQARIEKEAADGENVNWFTAGLLAAFLKMVSWGVFAINYLIGLIGGMFFALGGVFLQLGLQLNANLIQSPIVQTGWVIVRDVANLGFVIAIIFIALATILQLANYDTKKMLWRLVWAALLVNFSLTLIAIPVALSDLLSNFFITKATANNPGGFAVNLAAVFKVQELLKIKDPGALPDIKGGLEFGQALFGLIASVFFVAFFTSVSALTILTVAFMIFARYIALSILIILMPVVWLMWIFPGGERYVSDWWGRFTKWLTFLPAAAFFIYLTILLVNNYAQDPKGLIQLNTRVQTQTGTFLDKFLSAVANPVAVAGQMVVVVMLLGGGLIAAGQVSDQAANSALGLAKTTHGWLIGQVKGAGRQIRRGAGLRFWQKQVAEEAGQPISRAERWSRRLSAIPIPGFRGIASTIGGYRKEAADEIEQYRKQNLDVFSKEALLARAQDRKIIGPVQAAALAVQLAKKDLIDKITVEDREFYLKSAQKFGKVAEILENRPDLAPIVGRTIKEVMNKMKAGKADAISADALKIKEVAIGLDRGHLQRLGREGSEEQRKNIKETVRAIRDEMRAGNTFAGQTQSAQAITEILDKLNKMDDFITHNPQWQA